MTGVDFSAQAVALCRERYTRDRLTFSVGDAENLAFPDAAFDVVVNVESSHCYGSMPAFLSEVFRVLKPGGHFVCADFRDSDKVQIWREQIAASGLMVISEREITPNVLAALDADNDRKIALMEKIIPRSMLASFSDFAAVKGSLVYEYFRKGGMQYFHFIQQKPA
jgi:ubiquinone/menaquinone biosynthesis C-methylase UbiE